MLLRYTCPMWTGSLLLLGFVNCVWFVGDGWLARQRCNEYRDITAVERSVSRWKTIYKPLVSRGEHTNCGEFPHHALLGYPLEGLERKYEFRCGGTLISEQHVMTAAHCFSETDPTIVRLGEYDTTNATGKEYDVQIAEIRKHPQYKNYIPYHDIALVKLANRLYFTSWIRPACLWDTEYRNVTRYIATGFGITQMGGPLSTVMMKVQLNEFPVDDCAREFKFHSRFDDGIIDGQLCVGSSSEGRDTCPGDSGGPLLTVTSPNCCIYHVVGIISRGRACGIGKARAIYTKVSHYIGWIEDNVWGDNCM